MSLSLVVSRSTRVTTATVAGIARSVPTMGSRSVPRINMESSIIAGGRLRHPRVQFLDELKARLQKTSLDACRTLPLGAREWIDDDGDFPGDPLVYLPAEEVG